MDSVLVTPKNKKELKAIMKMMDDMGALYKIISQENTDEFEMAMMIKSKVINASGIIRQDIGVSKMTVKKKEALDLSEIDIKSKLIFTEQKIQIEEDEWLNQ